MSFHVGIARERLFEVDTAANAAAIAGGLPLVPHLVLSPRTSRGLPTSGLTLVLLPYPAPNGVSYGTPAAASAPGFTVTLFRIIPTSPGLVGVLAAYPSANFGDQLTLPDISGGMALYVGISNVATPGLLMVGIAELD